MTDLAPLEQPDDLKSRALAWVTRAEQVSVVTQVDYEIAIADLKRLKSFRRVWKEHNADAIGKAKAAWEAVRLAWSSIDSQLDTAYDIVLGKCETWVTQTRDAHAHALQDAARASAPTPQKIAAHLAAAFDAAVERGDHAKAAQILEQSTLPQIVQDPLPPPPGAFAVETPYVPKVAGVAVTTPWTWEVIDESLVPREYLMLDRKKISAVVKAMKADTRIAGIHVRPETGLRVRE